MILCYWVDISRIIRQCRQWSTIHEGQLVYDSVALPMHVAFVGHQKISVYVVRQLVLHLLNLKFQIVVLLVVINAEIMSIDLS